DHERGYAIGQHITAVRSFWRRGENRRGIKRFGSARQSENSVVIVCWLIGLNAQHRKVLGHVVSEDRTEDSKVVAPAVSGPDDSLRVHLVRNPEARRE